MENNELNPGGAGFYPSFEERQLAEERQMTYVTVEDYLEQAGGQGGRR